MRIYQLYDALTRFEFSLRYYKAREYLALDIEEIIGELKVSEFKLNNFYISQEFLNIKLNEILQVLKYLQKALLYNIDKSDGEYYHDSCLRVMLEVFKNKGMNVVLDPLFDGNTKILYHLTNDIKQELQRRIDIVEKIQNGFDYVYEPREDNVLLVLNDLWKDHLSRSKVGEITPVEWHRLKLNKYHELSQTDDYKKFFTKEGLAEFELLKENIVSKWEKKKYAMFIRLLNLKGYFIEDLSIDLMIRFANLLTKNNFNKKDFEEAPKYNERWLDLGGFEIKTVY
ncbi:hypothetical protein CHU00_17665 [Sphingobacterium cellulitidis]|uniref:hypothetical protein n=1 Tax=Sphingobacterium cellulitidis TaxID=1768011 RepID=UPI000B940B45|nr:hypothetical protein [Sphingobacterium cellulitidis]OYD44269.1 hypothetical protein CHU00_17665 [Sphingobacterium cellulitidis]